MSVWFFQKSNLKQWLPKLQSHRGYCVDGASENSLASIQKAFELGYEMAEFDVRITADQIVILNHDPDIEGVLIQKSKWIQLAKLKQLETLEQVFAWLVRLGRPDFKLNVELKSRSIFRSDLERITCRMIDKYQIQNQVMVSSFNPLALAWVRFYNSKIYRALLLTFEKETGNHWFIKKMILNVLAAPHGLNLRYQDWSSQAFYKIAEKVPVVLWTCNDLKFYKEVEKQVHGIISDEIIPQNLKD